MGRAPQKPTAPSTAPVISTSHTELPTTSLSRSSSPEPKHCAATTDMAFITAQPPCTMPNTVVPVTPIEASALTPT